MARNKFERIFEAVGNGDVAEVRSLLNEDRRLADARNEGGATPLHVAALKGYRDVVELLVEHGAAINASDTMFGATPSAWAIEYLRELGGFLSVEIDDMVFAIHNGDVIWVERFLERWPAALTCRDADGKTMLDHANESGNSEIINLFRSRGPVGSGAK